VHVLSRNVLIWCKVCLGDLWWTTELPILALKMIIKPDLCLYICASLWSLHIIVCDVRQKASPRLAFGIKCNMYSVVFVNKSVITLSVH